MQHHRRAFDVVRTTVSVDAYLPGLAEQRGARLATVDRRLTRLAGRPELVEVLTP